MTRPELDRLVAAYLDGSHHPADLRALADSVEADAQARGLLAHALYADRLLRAAGAAKVDVACVMRALPTARGTDFQDRVLARIARTVPLRRRRERVSPERLLVAASLLLAALLAALLLGRSAEQGNHDLTIARMQATRDAVWGGPDLHGPNERLAATRLELKAGLAEIAFDSGARLLLEGPAVLELESAMRVRLLAGRATAEVPAPAHGFTIAARGVEVVDRGTAFGLEVMRDGRSEVQVFTGQVDALLVGDAAGQSRTSLHADQAVRLDPWRGTIARVTPDSARFVRTLSPQRLQLMLADLISGGDGRGSGDRDGIDPRSGEIVSGPALGVMNGDNRFHATTGSRFVDGVFIPDGAHGPTAIDSLGHLFQFPASDGKAYDLVRRGGTLESPEYGGNEHPRIPPVFGGVDYENFGHTAIGMHANVGFTIDLLTLAAAHSGMRPARFTARVANVGRKQRNEGMADFWELIDGRMLQHLVDLTPASGSFPIDVLLAPGDHYLTLVASDAGNGNGLDWVTLGDPRLQLSREQAGR
jgi:hypothetical protein